MTSQNQIKEKAQDEKLLIKTKKSLLQRVLGRFISFLRSYIIKLKLKIQSFIKRMKKLFIHEEYRKELQKKQVKNLSINESKYIPTVLKDTTDLENKVNKYLESNQEVVIGKVYGYHLVEKSKTYEECKKHIIASENNHLHQSHEKKLRISDSTLSISSIESITQEILKNNKVKSFLERELSRAGREPIRSI